MIYKYLFQYTFIYIPVSFIGSHNNSTLLSEDCFTILCNPYDNGTSIYKNNNFGLDKLSLTRVKN